MPLGVPWSGAGRRLVPDTNLKYRDDHWSIRPNVPSWLRVQTNPFGEWSVTDLRRGTRVCAYHGHVHGGVHLHVPEEGPVEVRLELASVDEAVDLVRRYAARHDRFELAAFRKEVLEWRSTSRNG